VAPAAGADRLTVSRLFVYGTLQDDERIHQLVGRRLPWRPAVLEGYCRMLDSSIGYPVVHPLAGASVDGKLLEDVDAQTLSVLDAYEGGGYHRVVVQVQTSDGRAVDAYLYVPLQAAGPAPRS